MIKYPGLVGEPSGGPGIAGTEPPPRLDRVESFFVTAVQAQPNAKIKMSNSKVSVELDRAVRVRYRGAHISSPMACLGEHILGLRVFTIESQSLKGGFACLTHERSEVLDRPVIPLHDQRAGKSKVGVRQVRIERKCSFEQTVGCLAIAVGALVHMPEPALTVIPRAHMLRPFRDYALGFGAGQRRLDRGDDTRGDVVLHCEDVGQIPVVTLGPEMGAGG